MAFRSVPRPSSPPGAKASTECPYHTPIQGGSRLTPEPPTMHGNHRQTHVVHMAHARAREERGVSPVPFFRLLPADLNQSSSAQNPDAYPFLEENGSHPDQYTQRL
jgi:hypothetical protein